MELNLRVVNRQTQGLDREAGLDLTEGGITIGRSPTNDLCLDDPERVVSGHHARLDLRDGGVWVTDTSRNGTYLNRAADPLPSHQAIALYDGDRLTIGPYDILVVIADSAEPPGAPAADAFSAGADDLPGLEKVGATTDILDLLDPGGSRGVAGAQPSRDAEQNLVDDPFADALPLDERLAGPAPQAPAPEAPHRHTPVENVFYRPAEHQEVPEDYDLLNDSFGSREDDAGSAPAPEPPAMPPGPEPDEVPQDALADQSAPPLEERPPAGPPPRRPEPPRPKPTPSHPRPGGELEAFLSGLGVGDPAQVQHPEALLRQAGELLRALAAGLSQTMVARAQFKSELRLGVTSIRAAENNPFKFSVDADDLLDRLLFRPSPGFLPAVTATREAFDDVQAHEMAMTAGLQAALRALFARFEPAQLERRLSRRSGLDQVLPMARKARYWDLFTETYDEVAADAAEDFMELFGGAFARAYEEQIRRLGEARRA